MSESQGRTVAIPHPTKAGQTFPGYLVMPAVTPAPGMLVVHEAFGIDENIRAVTDRFAKEGYVALAADLFADGNRMVCMFAAFYGLMVTPLTNGTIKSVRAAFDYLQRLDGVDGKRIGAIGFCMGGSYALELACLEDEVRAISITSAMNPRPIEAVARACPVAGSCPQKDFTTGAGRKLDVALDEYKVPHDIKIYEGAGHSLMNANAPRHNPEIAADAWQRTLAFFDQHIRTG